LTSYAIKLELLMKGGIAGHILPVGAQINCFFGRNRSARTSQVIKRLCA
jgi:hypothetical protein